MIVFQLTFVFQEEDDQIYDEISEDEYRNIVKGRLLRDDFVIEDGEANSGYVDNGQDDWMEAENEASGQESDHGKRKSCMYGPSCDH